MKRSHWIALGAGGLVVAAAVWALFRPELLFIDREVSEPAMTGSVLATGAFHGVAHETEGTATVLSSAEGRTLRLAPFRTSNGPDVRVTLIAADDSTDDAEIEAVDLGPLKGNVGEQNYAIPADVDLKRHRAVRIWCRRFGVNFATAPLR